MPACFVRQDAMGVRAFLALRVNARTLKLLHVRGLAQTPVAAHREDTDVPAHVVSHQHEPPGGVQRHVAGRAPLRGLLV